ncbi:MAG: MFS transporter, partial [Deltaproteobacteria bacterium]|nr:MFS transporter [Deltaproteobacteria bacterium]
MIPRKYRAWCLLAFGTALYFFANVQRVAIPGSIFNVLQEELDVSAPYITAFGSSFMYVYAFCQLGIGLLVDRYGGSRVIAFGALLFCIGSIMFPLSNTLFMLYLSRTIVGLGASSLYLSLVCEILRTFNKRFTIMLSIMILIGYIGGIMANAPFVWTVNIVGWRMVMLYVAGVSVGFYLLFLLTKSSLRMPKVKPIPFSARPHFAVLKKRHNRNLFLFCGINFGLYYVLQTVIGKKFLEDFCRMESDRAAVILSVMGAISAISGLSFAIASSMLGNRRRIFLRIVGVSCFLVFSSITTLVFFEVRTVWLAVLMCMLSFTASTFSIAVPLLRETNHSEFTGVSVSMLNFGCYISVAIFGNLVGFLMNLFPPTLSDGIKIYGANSYLAVFGVMLLLACVVTWCAFQLRETMGKDMA